MKTYYQLDLCILLYLDRTRELVNVCMLHFSCYVYRLTHHVVFEYSYISVCHSWWLWSECKNSHGPYVESL